MPSGDRATMSVVSPNFREASSDRHHFLLYSPGCCYLQFRDRRRPQPTRVENLNRGISALRYIPASSNLRAKSAHLAERLH